MARRALLAFVLCCIFAAPALADEITQKQQIDAAIRQHQARLAEMRASETVLRQRISVLDDRIGALEAQVGSVSERLAVLQQDLALRQKRLVDLSRLYALQTRRLNALKRHYTHAIQTLNSRLVSIYESGTPTTLDFVLGASSIDDMLESLHFMTLVGKEDRRIVAEVKRSKVAMQASRLETRAIREKVIGDKRALAETPVVHA